MFEAIIFLLIYIALVVGAAYLVLWVLGKLGIEIPPMVLNVFWVIVVLVIILLLWRMLGPILTAGHLPGMK